MPHEADVPDAESVDAHLRFVAKEKYGRSRLAGPTLSMFTGRNHDRRPVRFRVGAAPARQSRPPRDTHRTLASLRVLRKDAPAPCRPGASAVSSRRGYARACVFVTADERV
ncbi:hypothetical protein EVAR_4211_1 [Eumeta japonica]|uniref:Uncharacterized protein n=1 Tax=Eumeta variegata TaxID=151549 RepID=A0A4C1TJ48_EUMVA|nr:hypothetical protein EVAR_4211_1 [Eumeta japonica]